ncbi:C4-dicarboxylate ABC transporter, partial [Enterococcus faecium]
MVYGILPLLPIFLLLIVFIGNIVLNTTLNISVQVVCLISFMFAVIIEFFNRRSINTVLNETSFFFEGMGNVMNIVGLLVS